MPQFIEHRLCKMSKVDFEPDVVDLDLPRKLSLRLLLMLLDCALVRKENVVTHPTFGSGRAFSSSSSSFLRSAFLSEYGDN